MPKVRFNHLELTFPRGALDKQLRTDIDAFWCGVFGWESLEVDLLGQTCHLLRPDDGQFILLAESDKPLESPGYDHLGLLCDTRGEVDELLGQIRSYQESDDRVRIKEYKDLTSDRLVVHAFYVKYLLPIFFDVQCMEWTAGEEPQQRWQYQ